MFSDYAATANKIEIDRYIIQKRLELLKRSNDNIIIEILLHKFTFSQLT